MKNLFRNKTGLGGNKFKLQTLAAAVLCAVAGGASAVLLTNANSTATIDPGNAGNFIGWTVDGQQELFQETWFYRIGATGPEINLSTLGFVTFNTPSFLDVIYTGPGFTIEITYSLLGGVAGSHTSDVGEQVLITNTSGSTLDFHFFEYTDFDLGGTAGGDSVHLVNPNLWRQSGDGFVLSETTGVPTAAGCEDGLFATTLTSLTDGSPTNFAVNLPANCGVVNGDVTWAWQWNVPIASGGIGASFLISKDKHLSASTPEPGSLMLLGLGLGCLAAWGRRHAKKDA